MPNDKYSNLIIKISKSIDVIDEIINDFEKHKVEYSDTTQKDVSNIQTGLKMAKDIIIEYTKADNNKI